MVDAGRRSPASGTLAVVAGLTIIGLALRLPSFGDSLWGDELSTNFVVNGFGAGSIIHIVLGEQEGTPPLFFLLTWLTKWFDGVEGLRVISLLAGVVSIPLTYLLGVRTVGQRAALVATALMALAPFQIFYATEGRAYALAMFFCLLAALTLLLAAESEGYGWWIAYGLSVAAAAYTHYTTGFVLIALFGWAFLFRPHARLRLVLATAGAAVLFLPWLPEFLDDRHEPAASAIQLLHPLTFHNAADDLLHWSIGHPFINAQDLPGPVAIWLMIAAAVLGAIGVVLRLRQRNGEPWWPMPGGLSLVIVLAAAAPVGAALEHILGPTIFSTRNIITSSPGLALAAGLLVTAGPKPWRIGAPVLLLAGFAIGAVMMLDTANRRPDAAGPVDYIEANGPPDAPVADAFSLTPGPQTGLEAAFAPKGQAYPANGRKVLTLGAPTLADRLRVRYHGGVNLLDPLPVPSDKQLADEAARAAETGRTIFVTAGRGGFADLERGPGVVANFIHHLPACYQGVASRSFPGLGLTGITVYVYRCGGRA
jgi:4-amino-4-deoxy-L-arabinose transferase-like glycosyltransferase